MTRVNRAQRRVVLWWWSADTPPEWLAATTAFDVGNSPSVTGSVARIAAAPGVPQRRHVNHDVAGLWWGPW